MAYRPPTSYTPPPANCSFSRASSRGRNARSQGSNLSSPFQPTYISPIFLVPKTSGGFRLILDLSSLNQHIQTPRFRITNHTELADRLSLPAWMASLDLQDAYLHIPIRKSLHQYLAFILDNQLWFFRAMPFGLSPAPALFTRVLRWPLSLLRSQGVHILAYLDDWILRVSSSDTLREHVRWTCTTLSRLDWIINWPKSHLTPSMNLIWLGVR